MDTIPPEALLAEYPTLIRAIGERLRALVLAAVPDAIERVRPGWRLIGYDVPVAGPGHRRSTYFAYVAPEPRHIHLGFEHGALMADPTGSLTGAGITKRVRWLTFLPGDRPDPDIVRTLLTEARRVALLPRDERLAATMVALESDRAAAAPGRLRAAR